MKEKERMAEETARATGIVTICYGPFDPNSARHTTTVQARE